MASLNKVLTWRQGAGLTIAGVLGSGVLILPEVTAQMAGPAAMVAWLTMACLAIPTAWTFGRLGTRYPDAGGIASYVRAAFGDRAGRMVGILYLGTVPVAAPAAALIGAGYMGALLHWSNGAIVLLAAALLVTALVINLLGVEWSGKTATGIVLGISALLVAAVASAVTAVHWRNFGPFSPHGWWPVGQSIALLYWAFVGWEMVGHLAEEFVDPVHNIPKSLGLAVVVIDVLYLSVVTVTIGTKSYDMGHSGAGLAKLVGLGLGPWGAMLTAVIALLITYGTMHTYIAGFSRLVYAQSRLGDLPPYFSKLHDTWHTPYRVLAMLVIPFAIVLGAKALFDVSLATLIAWPSAVFIALYLLAMASAWRLLKAPTERFAALIVGLVSFAAFIFVGWAALLPAVLGLTGWAMAPTHEIPPQTY
ncbi:APC family permease [Sulfobacillus sp. hq2]|uniref:APC family permease n=1 Tax=Sulfobacillus TaxID=28033 RepID=UPI000CD3103C|nr:amino acid permease [Sulfobacillus sp. hq2]POB09076.1 amino acid transporter [Sulfobacillus sp. hq2]